MNNQQNVTEESIAEKIQAALNDRVYDTELSATDVERFQNLESMSGVIRQLKELQPQAATFPNLELFAYKNYSFLVEAREALKDGSFYTSIEMLWDKESISFEEADVTEFNRGHHVCVTRIKKINTDQICNDLDDRYEKTATEAEKSTNSVASKSTPSDVPFKVDIFGIDATFAQSAHLMPQSPECAATWFPFVPWVLKVTATFNDDDNNNLKWDYVTKCIHGFKKNKKREDDVGIKHFRSNRISLLGQTDIFDTHPCLLIVPIMTVKQVKDWNGEGYDAIVLAGHHKPITPDQVYQMIGAAHGTLRFATLDECNTACNLLRQIILCVCKSLKSTFPLELLTTQMRSFQNKKILEQLSTLLSPPQTSTSMVDVPLPLCLNLTTTSINVRKVSFSPFDESIQSDDGSNMHPAPDPVLLCGKAAKNWLKRMDTPYLAGCDNNAASGSLDFVATYEEEAALRGWTTTTTETFKEVVLHHTDTFDESLSDIE
jgi:hypothetical protein